MEILGLPLYGDFTGVLAAVILIFLGVIYWLQKRASEEESKVDVVKEDSASMAMAQNDITEKPEAASTMTTKSQDDDASPSPRRSQKQKRVVTRAAGDGRNEEKKVHGCSTGGKCCGECRTPKSGRKTVPVASRIDKIRIWYASQTGTAEGFAQTLLQYVESTGLEVSVESLSKVEEPLDRMAEEAIPGTLNLFLVSTYTDGKPPEACDWFLGFLPI
ncbi:unnamed protein product [Cyprideis torosa]|uniref:Uncharacterized protein n=1 Tax=Cyprideis torosa TaxID=163714 RepID=A0A7R8W5R7_9CRUS|nr:unnamed protein product [Cyprideis torosa]CAG0885500.1 unnamed protein product [Cyprideis torosa]